MHLAEMEKNLYRITPMVSAALVATVTILTVLLVLLPPQAQAQEANTGLLHHVLFKAPPVKTNPLEANHNQLASRTEPADKRADLLVIFKTERKMHILQGGELLKSFDVALGPNPVGHKVREGDGRTPEGAYKIDFRLKNSNFHRAIRISYPSNKDRQRAKRLGVSPGGQIMIHGLPNGRDAAYVNHPYEDWTQGCIALNNTQMDYIWQNIDTGTRILILP